MSYSLSIEISELYSFNANLIFHLTLREFRIAETSFRNFKFRGFCALLQDRRALSRETIVRSIQSALFLDNDRQARFTSERNRVAKMVKRSAFTGQTAKSFSSGKRVDVFYKTQPTFTIQMELSPREETNSFSRSTKIT